MQKNLIAIVGGGVVTMIIGAIWYSTLSGPWIAASGISMEAVEVGLGASPYIASFIAWMVAAAALGWIFDKVGDNSWGSVFTTGFMVWLSVGITSTILTTMYADRGMDLLWIDGLYTLICVWAILSVRKLVCK